MITQDSRNISKTARLFDLFAAESILHVFGVDSREHLPFRTDASEMRPHQSHHQRFITPTIRYPAPFIVGEVG
jgi:hypothetical protein